jgi:hypothetical protein
MLSLSLAIAAVLVSGGVVWWSKERFDDLHTALAHEYDDGELRALINAHAESIDELHDQVRGQTLAIAEGIERVDRSERRVRAAIGRARKRMEDLGYVDESLEAEHHSIYAGDGDGGNAEGVQPVHEAMAGPEQADMSAFPGRW